MLCAEVDHITIVAPTLAAGVEHVRRKLGVTPQMGGEHPRMGTHNRLLKLGPKIYLEVIAINPDAPPPVRPRWYGLDQFGADQEPRLATWIVRTSDIEGAAVASPVNLGAVEDMTRGALHWRITIPPDGSLPLGGIAPTLIQWPVDTHPADSMPDLGCALMEIEAFHPDPAQVSAVLAAIGFDGKFRVDVLQRDRRPYLMAHIQSPLGNVSL